ncbi:MAG: hypothetical protein H6Q07_1728 [Acidobacteria bacterium]|nr:hypothetical protein [Acidobacteriota bacterium]
MKTQQHVSLHGNNRHLYPNGMNVIVHRTIEGRAAGVIGDLPTAIPCRTDFKQHGVVFLDRQMISDNQIFR